MTIFFLGAHQPHWLTKAGVPLFVSRERLKRYKKALPRAVAPWSLDSGGFSVIAAQGRWTITEKEYVADVRRYQRDIGGMLWAAPMDWMCEPAMIERTGLSVVSHQQRTVDNYHRLRALAPELPIIPVLQGFTWSDYMRCMKMYEHDGVRLADVPLVGLGSVCRRQATDFVADLAKELHDRGIRCHAFGVKIDGLRKAAKWLVSADSMAWSKGGRESGPCPKGNRVSCANCWHFARRWHRKVIRAISVGQSPRPAGLFAGMY